MTNNIEVMGERQAPGKLNNEEMLDNSSRPDPARSPSSSGPDVAEVREEIDRIGSVLASQCSRGDREGFLLTSCTSSDDDDSSAMEQAVVSGFQELGRLDKLLQAGINNQVRSGSSAAPSDDDLEAELQGLGRVEDLLRQELELFQNLGVGHDALSDVSNVLGGITPYYAFHRKDDSSPSGSSSDDEGPSPSTLIDQMEESTTLQSKSSTWTEKKTPLHVKDDDSSADAAASLGELSPTPCRAQFQSEKDGNPIRAMAEKGDDESSGDSSSADDDGDGSSQNSWTHTLQRLYTKHLSTRIRRSSREPAIIADGPEEEEKSGICSSSFFCVAVAVLVAAALLVGVAITTIVSLRPSSGSATGRPRDDNPTPAPTAALLFIYSPPTLGDTASSFVPTGSGPTSGTAMTTISVPSPE